MATLSLPSALSLRTSISASNTTTMPFLVARAPASTTGNKSKSKSKSNANATAVSSPNQLTVSQNLACGAVARCVSIFSMFPIDTVKTRLQTTRTTLSATASTARKASLLSSLTSAMGQGRLYSGVGVTLLGQVPYAMLAFGLFETIQTQLETSAPHLPSWLRIVLSAAAGDSIGSLWLTPSEVVKSKTQAGLYPGPFTAIRSIAATGPFSFYQGYFAALARDVPFRAIQMLLYDRCRRLFIRLFKQPNRASHSTTSSVTTPVDNLIIGAVSGTITAIATNPLDVIRTRMMSQPPGRDALYRNALHCVFDTLRLEGPAALLRGIGPRALLIGPASAMFFLTYEGAKSFFRSRSASTRRTASLSASTSTFIAPRRLPAYRPV